MGKSNYSNDDKSSSPFKRGKFKEVVKPTRFRHTRPTFASAKDETHALTIDLVQVLADVGICLQNVHTIAKGLHRLGWTKAKKVKG